MKKSRLLGTVFSCAMILSPLQSFAVDKNWICDNDFWDSNGCWSPSGQPISGDSVFLTQSDSLDRSVIYSNSLHPSAELNNLTIDATGAGSISLNQSQDNLTSKVLYIGYDGSGVFNQNGGTNMVGTPFIDIGGLYLGYNSDGNGTYNLNAGTLTSTFRSSTAYIGYNGTGTFNQSGGNTTIEVLKVGTGNGTGTYNLSNGGVFTAGHTTIGGNGTFNQSGGTSDPGNALHIDTNGTYNISGGELFGSGPSMDIEGTLNQTGGLVYAGSFWGFYLNGAYNMSAGETFISGKEIISGTFNQSGGSHKSGSPVGTEFEIGMEIDGSYNFTGGTLDAPRIAVLNGGSFNFDGGTLSVDKFTGDLINIGGTLASYETPDRSYQYDASPGVTNIVGNYVQSTYGFLEVNIGGINSGEFDVFDVTGMATLGGTLDVNLLDLDSDLLNLALGDTFDILFAESIMGEFDILSLNRIGNGLDWSVSYNLNDFGADYVRLSVVTEPPMILLIGSGLIGLIGLARRKKA